ncbi:hypothetical protein TSAR_015360 [Trichomalopsis sarcophagae]|uniref:Uncharacterized protein n=1 Tax=Trichomalopsis sarcophagae TaxID=543379 RepID=A0A232ESB0_9HYME|nr:hypothetical protein TSAR_015360 [Trichomalopsis sarcophagae]
MEHETGWPIQYSVNSCEKRLLKGPLEDRFCVLENNNKVVLQFHGCYWHGRVRCYTDGRNLSIVNGESMDDRYERTLRVSEIGELWVRHIRYILYIWWTKIYAYKYLTPDGRESYPIECISIEKINFECMRKLVIGEIPPTFVSFGVSGHTALHDVVTRAKCKVCEPVYSKRRFAANDKSYPYGYVALK